MDPTKEARLTPSEKEELRDQLMQLRQQLERDKGRARDTYRDRVTDAREHLLSVIVDLVSNDAGFEVEPS